MSGAVTGTRKRVVMLEGRPQRALISEVFTRSSLGLDDLWNAYRAGGGGATCHDIHAYLQRAVDLPARESNVLADALNGLLKHDPASSPVAIAAEDGPYASPEASRQALGAAGAFLLSEEEKEQERVRAVARTGLLDTPPEERFERIARKAQQRFRSSSAIITLIDDRRQFLKAVIGTVQQNMPKTRSFCNTTIQTPGPLVVRDAFIDDRFKWNPLVLGEPFIRFYAGHPIHDPEGWIIGTLCVIDQTTRTFDDDDERHLHDIALEAQQEINA